MRMTLFEAAPAAALVRGAGSCARATANASSSAVSRDTAAILSYWSPRVNRVVATGGDRTVYEGRLDDPIYSELGLLRLTPELDRPGEHMESLYLILIALITLFVLYVIFGSFFTISTAQVAVITRFGK